MTALTDFERLVASWLETTGPADVDPDVIEAAFLEAAGTRQRRPLPIVGSQALPTMRVAIAPYVAAALIVTALIAGAILAAGGRPAPPPPPRVLASPAASVAAAPTSAAGVSATFLGDWMGAAPPGADASAPRHTAMLSIDAIGLWLSDRSSSSRVNRFPSTVVTDGSAVHLSATPGSDCEGTTDGDYHWSLSPGGTTLVVTATADPCTSRAAALAGTWYRMGCAQWAGTCIGHLEPGTYPSWNFEAATDAAGPWNPILGGLTYTVPDGWTNSHDFQAGYWLEPTDWHDALVGASGNIDDHDRPVMNGIYVMSDPAAALQDADCTTGLADPSVGGTVADLVDFLTHHPALEASEPAPIVIGGLAGEMVDVRLKPTWSRSCPGMNMPGAALFTLRGGTTTTVWNDTGTTGPAVDRYILLDLGGGQPVLVQISAPSAAALDPLLADAMPIVKTFRFQP